MVFALKSKRYKLIIVAVLLMAALAFYGCGKKQAEIAEPTETIAPTPTPDPTPTPIPTIGIEAGDYQLKYEDENGGWLDYWVYIPENATEGMPLICYLHGDGLSTRIDYLPNVDIAKKVKELYGYDFPFILITPNNRGPEWFDYGMDGLVKGLIDQCAETYKVNKDKIIITGHSRGAIATWELADEFGDYFSCAVPVSCGARKIHGENLVDVPVWGFIGDGVEDQQSYYHDMKYFARLINDAGGQAEISIVENADHPEMGYAAYTKEVFDWMIAQ